MTEQDLAGRLVIVTRGASGIGLACAREFAGRGAHVVVADFNTEAAQAAASDIGRRAWVTDLSDTTAQENLDLHADILVNNAGVQTVAPIPEFEPDRWRFMHRLMVESPFLLIRAVLPGMYERGWGRIVNISSAHGLRASAFKSAYVSAKHALEGLSKVTALEGGPHGVTSNCINPAYVRTPLVEKQIADQAKLHGIDASEVPEDATETVVKLSIELEAASTGWLAGLDDRRDEHAARHRGGGRRHDGPHRASRQRPRRRRRAAGGRVGCRPRRADDPRRARRHLVAPGVAAARRGTPRRADRRSRSARSRAEQRRRGAGRHGRARR